MQKPTTEHPTTTPQKPSKPSDFMIGLLILLAVIFLIVTGVWRLLTYPIDFTNPLSLVISIVTVLLMAYGLWYVFRTLILRR
jgi:uncharacterized membrane protein